MSDTSPQRDPSPTIDYAPPKAPRNGCLTVALIFAAPAFLFNGGAALLLLGQYHSIPSVILIIMDGIFLLGAIRLVKANLISAALAVTIIAIAAFFLAVGICSKFDVPIR